MSSAKAHQDRGPGTPPAMRVLSWNLLRRVGANVHDVARLVRGYHPDLLLLQEATEDVTALPALVGGHFFRHPMHERIYGLAAWSPHAFPPSTALRLPFSVLPGRVPPRVAQIVKFHGISFANVHLSHGQFLNRWQLLHIAAALEGPAAIIGDFNAVGPIRLEGFKDIGRAAAPTVRAISFPCAWTAAWRAAFPATRPRSWTRGHPTITPSCWIWRRSARRRSPPPSR